MNKDLKIPFGAPLDELDSETQTFGCRQKNLDICDNNYPVFAPLPQTITPVGGRRGRGKGSMQFSRFKPLNDDLTDEGG